MNAKVGLAKLYVDLRELTKAKDILTPILRQSEDTSKCEEKTFKVIVDAKHAMAHIYLLEGNCRGAEALQLEVVTLLERAFTREHDDTQVAIHDLALIYSELGQFDKAKNLLDEAVSTTRCSRGETHPATCQTIQSLAKVYIKLERYEKSLGILEELLHLMPEDPDHDHPLRISVIEQIAVPLQYLHRYDEEIKLREQALAMRQQRQGFDHVRTLESTVCTADCYLRLERHEEAMGLWKGVVPIAKEGARR